MEVYNKMLIQFVEVEKRLKKGVDIWRWLWYYNKAVARERRKQEKNGCGSGPEGIQRHGNGAFGFQFLNGSSEIKNKKSLKKLLTNAKQCDIIIKSLNERVQ